MILLALSAAAVLAGTPDNSAAPVNPAPLARDTRRGPAPAVPRLLGGRGLDSLISEADYPEAARRQRLSGPVRLRLTVNIDGRVTGCEILRSSGTALLDASACRILVRRARFWPALDRSSRPIVSTFEHQVKWVLPASASPVA